MSILVIVPYFNRPIDELVECVRFYASLDQVVGVQVVEFETGKSAAACRGVSDKVHVVCRPNDLRHRFVIDHPCTSDLILICDDDIYPTVDVINALSKHLLQQGLDTLVGVWGRNCHGNRYSTRQVSYNPDIVLTKLMIAERQRVHRVGQFVCRHGHLLGALPLNGEDIVFSMLWTYCIGNVACCGAGVVSKIVEKGGATGLHTRPLHIQQRTNTIKHFLANIFLPETSRYLQDHELRVLPCTRKKPLITRCTFDRGVVPKSTKKTNRPASWYWIERYNRGGSSGAASYGRSAVARGQYISTLIRGYQCTHVIDFGCGDVDQVQQIKVPFYMGVDASSFIIRKCIQHTHRCFRIATTVPSDRTDAILLLDMIKCLTDDFSYHEVLRTTFLHPTATIVIIAAKDHNLWESSHIRHRGFSLHIAETYTDWTRIENREPSCFCTPIHIYLRRGAEYRLKALAIYENACARRIQRLAPSRRKKSFAPVGS